MIKLKDINFAYSASKPILKDFSLSIEKGEFCSILGLNGIGKSTLIKIMSGYLKANSGLVEIAGKDINSYKAANLAKVRAVLEQDSQLSFSYKAREVVELGCFASNIKATHIEEIMHSCEILELENRNYIELSGGEKRRVSLARAIAQVYAEDMSGKILFLDEPSASLDPMHSNLIMRLAKNLQARNATIVSILHDPNLAYANSDKVVGIKDTKLAFCLSPKEFMQEANLKNLYNCDCEILTNGEKKLVSFV